MKRSLALISLCLLVGCSHQESQKLDLEKTAKAMIDTYYQADMIKADQDQIYSILMLDVKENTCTVYVSSNSETNELALCRGNDETIKQAFEQRRDYNLHSAENYFPQEVDKIKSSVIEKVGDAWVLITVEDSEAVLAAIQALL